MSAAVVSGTPGFNKHLWQKALLEYNRDSRVMTGAMWAVLHVIMADAWKDGTHAHPGYQRMIELTGYSRAQCVRATKALTDAQIIVLTQQGDGRPSKNGERTASEYRFGSPWLNKVLMDEHLSGNEGERPMPPLDGSSDASCCDAKARKGAHLGSEKVLTHEHPSGKLSSGTAKSLGSRKREPAKPSDELRSTDAAVDGSSSPSGVQSRNGKASGKRSRSVRTLGMDHPFADRFVKDTYPAMSGDDLESMADAIETALDALGENGTAAADLIVNGDFAASYPDETWDRVGLILYAMYCGKSKFVASWAS